MKHYDYIFTGTGLSALMTVYEMVVSEQFQKKQILLLDIDTKKTNDRTWCFWEEGKGDWKKIISEEWDLALFANEKFTRDLDLKPYQYKMIKGIDFYNKVFKRLSVEKNITFLNQEILGFSESGNNVVVQTNEESFSCNKLFNSIYNPELVLKQTKYPLLQQHFIGWFIKSEEAVFNSAKATFMDFSVEQRGNTRFMYVLPTSSTEALIEYTLFSKDLLPKEEYENEIQKYIQKLGITNYEIIEKEKGNIPMTCFPFWKENKKNILHIGSAGGWTKASTGYTFKNTTKKAKALVAFLNKETDFRKFHKRDKFWFYDLLLLDILDQKNHLGSTIFSSMFKKGNPSLIFKFLDEETSFLEDLQVIWKCPKWLFIKALFSRIGRL
ncbi:lycopene beta-cyclase [Flavobacterium arsenatis]|uniref:Lycopene beta-cyclase n=1 Tax=Flavobacterium arsenatis TaxID=1484332 RepID=A0ABU1TT54_9FLAO|nr:lycopene cyclase family protein [Flavobacterium arsenatis]MDR6969059.1 lycopene beta-cyclase [Flavobacterium arsenatis]